MITIIPNHQPCPTCGRCPTCGQYKPVTLGPIVPFNIGAVKEATWKPGPITSYYGTYPSTDRSL